MRALVFRDITSVQVEQMPLPMTSTYTTTRCEKCVKGDNLGHESMGIVHEIGPIVSACGTCDYCRREEFSLCDCTNPSADGMDDGTDSHMTGGYPGGQAEYLRVPYADVNCLKIDDENLKDESVLLLSDVLCTSWHACELGEVSTNQTVAVWGAGPIGLMTAKWAFFRGAKTVIVVDLDPTKAISEMVMHGVDVAIDCVGFRYAKAWTHTIEKGLFLETDSIDSLSECIISVRKGGKVSVIGDYLGYANHFPIGAMMEKGLTMRGDSCLLNVIGRSFMGGLKKGKSIFRF
ncbi:hypothetical protein HK098_001341 [Nowakowskiella sp. JEL0407]|nr:hypothetical protein HK098_001341 [Nowakowskiella sp. JEL0407]